MAIKNSNLNSETITAGATVSNKGTRLVQGQISRIHFVDEPTNRSKQYVEYDVVIRENFGGSSTYQNVRYIGDISGINDSSETVLEQTAFALSGKLGALNIPKNQNGTLVILAFLDGSLDKPLIIGGALHSARIAATRIDGIRKLGEYRGLTWEINKLGELIITYQGNKRADGQLVRPDTGPTQIKIDKDGVFTITDNEAQLIKIDRVTKSISITTKENYNIIVGKDKVETIAENRTTDIGTNETLNIGADKTTDIGADETVTTAGDRVHSAANHTLTGGGDIKLGSAGASENLVLGIAFQTLYNVHAHIGNLGIPTGNPLQPMSAIELAQKNFTE